jgi:WD40 repeat protein
MKDSLESLDTPASASDPWVRTERVARLLSIVAIPVVLAIGGWMIQGSLADRSLSQEYVKLAVTILKEPKGKDDNLLRSWAADLLNQNSPTKFDQTVLDALKKGQATLPAQISTILNTSGGGSALAVSPDGRRIGTGHSDGSARIWDAATGKEIGALKGHRGPVTALAFAPDASKLLTGSLDGTARLWDVRSGKPVGAPLVSPDGLLGVAFAPDGGSIFTRSRDGTIASWSSRTGRLVTRFQIPE